MDRHNKFRTAQGIRDRRMRLSIDFVRDFCVMQYRRSSTASATP
jgi:hypothetical protein